MPSIAVKRHILATPAGRDLIELLELGISVTVLSEYEKGHSVYLGFYPDELPPGEKWKALPLVGSEVSALYTLILNFTLGYIPTEVKAFKGEEDDIISTARL